MCFCSYLVLPTEDQHGLFWLWWQFPLQAPLLLSAEKSLFPVMFTETSACLGGTFNQYIRSSHLTRNWVDASPRAPQASEILWWGRGKVLVDASLTKGSHFAAFSHMQSIIVTAHPSPQRNFSKVSSLGLSTWQP